MRKILFRGKQSNGEWLYGNLTVLGESAFISENMGFNKMVIPKTVGQFTGLTDKNGTKIFEGDILEMTNEHPHRRTQVWRELVEYDESIASFTPLEAIQNCDYYEVIGNIHDNPELLGGE